MNSWIKYLDFCLMVCIILLSASCGPSGNDKNLEDSLKNLSSESLQIVDLGNDFLSDKNIKAFEQRALQKLEDLKDYFDILSSSKVDKAFKNQALDMAMELFDNRENTITFNLVENEEKSVQKVDSFFTSLQNGSLGMYSFEIHDIYLINKIKPLDDAEYKGGIKFCLYVKTIENKTPVLSNKIDLQCDIIAKKVLKNFGKESRQVWEVFLGDIYQIP